MTAWSWLELGRVYALCSRVGAAEAQKAVQDHVRATWLAMVKDGDKVGGVGVVWFACTCAGLAL